MLGFRGLGVYRLGFRVDDINPALSMIRNTTQFPWFRVLKVMQDVYHQQYERELQPVLEVGAIIFIIDREFDQCI